MDDGNEFSDYVLIGSILIAVCVICVLIVVAMRRVAVNPTTSPATIYEEVPTLTNTTSREAPYVDKLATDIVVPVVQSTPVIIPYRWIQYSGGLRYTYVKIVIDNNGKIYGLDPAGWTWYISPTSRSLILSEQLQMAGISINNSDIIAGYTSMGTIMYRKISVGPGDIGNWLPISMPSSGTTVFDISINDNNNIAFINSLHALGYADDLKNPDWKIINGEYKAVSINNRKKICVIDLNGDILFAESCVDPRWYKIPGPVLKSVKLTNMGVIFGVSNDGSMYYKNLLDINLSWHGVEHTSVFNASMNDNGIVCVINNNILEWTSARVI